MYKWKGKELLPLSLSHIPEPSSSGLVYSWQPQLEDFIYSKGVRSPTWMLEAGCPSPHAETTTLHHALARETWNMLPPKASSRCSSYARLAEKPGPEQRRKDEVVPWCVFFCTLRLHESMQKMMQQFGVIEGDELNAYLCKKELEVSTFFGLSLRQTSST